MDYLILSIDKDLKITDWTPFYNNKHNNLKHVNNIIYKGDLLYLGLSNLSKYGWIYKDTFINNKTNHFILIKVLNIK